MKSISSRFLPGWVVVAAAASFPSIVFSANVWDGGGGDGNWSTVTNWDTDAVPAFPVGINLAGTAGLTSTNDLTGIQVNGITFDSGAGAFLVGGNTITLGGDILNNSTSLQTINTGLILNATRTVNAASGDVSFGGPVTGAFALAKIGAGKLTLSGTGGTSQLAIGSNSAGGTVELSGGAWSQAGTITSLGLIVGAGNNASGALIVSGGTHTFGGDDYSNAARVGTALGAGQTATGSLTITGGLVRIGTASSTNAALNVGTSINAGTSNGTLDVSGGELQVGSRILIGANNAANTSSLTLSGTGVINMTRTGTVDPGQLRLGAGATTLNFNGGTFIGTSVNQGTATATSSIYYNGTEFRVNAVGSIIGGGGTAINQVKGGGLIIDTNSFNSNVDRALANFTGVNGNLTKKGLGTLSLTAANSITGTVSVESGTLAFSSAGTLGANAAIVVGSGAVLSFNRSDTLGNHATNVSQTITANGGTITNGNTFTTVGMVNLNGAALTSTGGANAQFPAFSLRGNVNVGGTAASTISSSGTNSGMLVGQNTAGTQTTFNVANATTSVASDLNVSAILRDNLNTGFTATVATGIRKTGSGTMALSGTNTYTGMTSVDQGTLAITGNGSIAASTTINVASGAFLNVSATTGTWSLAAAQTLRGNGTVVGNATIAGTLSAGNSIGSLVFTNDLALFGSSVFEVDAGAATSDLVTAGTLAFGGSLNVLNLNGTLAEGQAFNLFDFTSATGTFNSVDLPTLDGGLTWDISGLYSQGVITVVPEPSVALLLPVLGGVVLCSRRRRSSLA